MKTLKILCVVTVVAALAYLGTRPEISPQAPLAAPKVGSLKPRPAVSQPLTQPPPAAPEPLPSTGLTSFDPERLVAEIAQSKDSTVIELTIAVTSATTPLERGQAADRLAAHGGFEATANLLRVAALQETLEGRAEVLSALNNLNDAEGFSTLATGLAATRDPQFIDAISQHLTRCGDPQIIETLVSLYRERNDSAEQKSHVLRAIAMLNHPDLRPALNKLALHAPEAALAEAAAGRL